MILIISKSNDQTTNDVIDWLIHFGTDFVRVDEDSSIQFQHITLTKDAIKYEIRVDGKRLASTEITAVWYRRGFLMIQSHRLSPQDIDKAIFTALQHQVDLDAMTINEFIHLAQLPISINSQGKANVNKLHVLHRAAKHGLETPDTLVTTSRSELLAFIDRAGPVAHKTPTPGMSVSSSEFYLDVGTLLVDSARAKQLPVHFAASLFQRYVDKWIELRIYYLHGVCYASAIFSQMDDKTKIDFRNYNHAKPNRTPPFRLPETVLLKLRALMDDLDLNSGSIDMIVTPDLTYVFLEVNPVGQFWQVSYPCNYALEMQVASALAHG